MAKLILYLLYNSSKQYRHKKNKKTAVFFKKQTLFGKNNFAIFICIKGSFLRASSQ